MSQDYSSLPGPPPTVSDNIYITAYLIRNGTGRWQVMFSGIPANVQTIALYWYSHDYFYWDVDYSDPSYGYPFNLETDIPTSTLTNGIYVIPDSMTTNGIPNNAVGKVAYIQPIGSDGQLGNLSSAGFLPYDAPCFVDGQQHLKQNLLFELRAATMSMPCESLVEYYVYDDPYWLDIGIPADTNYVESGFFHWSEMFKGYGMAGGQMVPAYVKMDNLWPLTANYQLHQRLYDPNYTGPFDFVWQTNLVTVPASAVLGIGDPYWISQDFGNPADVAAYTNNGNLFLESGVNNLFGLTFKQALVNNGNPIVTLNTGSSVDMASVNCFYSQTAGPTLQLVNYYFAPVVTPGTALPSEFPPSQSSPLPCLTGFAATNQTGMIITSVGTPTVIGGWAKYSIQNGNSSKFAYLGQYFVTNAFMLDVNGNLTTNTTGVVSPYGDFFPTQPGTVAMITMPDIDPPYQQGTGVVKIVSLDADANHDGILDPSYAGPDQTSPSRPLRFWSATDDHAGDFGGTGLSGVEPSYLTDGSYSPGLEPVPNPLPGQPVFQARFSADGRRTLEDFFPVYLNIGSLFQSNALSAGISATDTNWQFVLSQADGALRFAYTSLTPTNYMNYLRDINVSSNLAYAHLVTITANGAPLSPSFVGGIAASNQGIILVEAWENTTQPLVLTIYHGTNQIAQTSLYLSISDVEQMFRYKNLLLNTDPSAAADRLTDASVPNEPDTTDKNFVFLHGYNVNPLQARGVFADMYKRMYWSGSHAKFYGVIWDGYDSQVLNAVTVNYHTNEVHACATVPMFTNFLASLSGTTVVAAHSLGNMVVLSALNDYHVQSIGTYFMIDAAIPMEAIQGNATPDSHLYYPDWIAYADKLNASHWFQLFSSGDGRNALTWNNRFENLQSADTYNFYSSGEEVLREYTNGAPPGELLASATQVAYYFENEFFNIGQPAGSYAWAWQEMLKGRGGSDGVMGSTHGGWKFNSAYATNGVQMPNSQATLLPNSQLQTNAFFDVTSSSFGNADLALFGTSGSSYAKTNQNRILSDAIPALTLPVGANPITGVGIVAGNTDMQTLENGWPAGRALNPAEANKWHHSDFHEVAYTFTHQLFDNIVTLGGLK